jgi:hypothetical protein
MWLDERWRDQPSLEVDDVGPLRRSQGRADLGDRAPVEQQVDDVRLG